MNIAVIQAVIGGLLLCIVLGVVTVLTWHGSITGNEAYGILTTIVSIGAGAFAVHAGVKAGANASANPPKIK